MSTNSSPSLRKMAVGSLIVLFTASGAVFAQAAPANAPQSSTPAQQSNAAPQDGWKRFNGGWSNAPAASNTATQASQAPAPSPTTATQVVQTQDPSAQSAPPADQQNPPAIIPDNSQAIHPDYAPQNGSGSGLALNTGTVITVRISQALSSDHNQVGDVFSATLTQPVVVHGVVIAQRGQVVAGRVMEAKKAGMVSGVSHLGLSLTSLTLADGQNLPIQSQLLVRKGPTSVGRDVAGVATTTGVGAAIGAAADWGRGAAIGAGAGAAVGILGVLLTRGYPTIVYPESLLTFQLTAPAAVDTDYAPQAFHAVEPSDYQQQTQTVQSPPQGAPPPYPYPAYGYPNPYYGYYGAGYYPYAYPFFYGPSFGFYYGYGRGYYGGYRGGFHGGFHGGSRR